MSRLLSRCVLLAALGGALVVSAPVKAQSAADLATARELARAGIQLFRDGKYADAADKLGRAQELYDAPIHLLYLARAQEKLGRLVEAAENYRKLARARLTDESPEPFRRAQADGAPELEKLLPRIPSVKILIEPSDIEGLELRIDGRPVSAAVVGVDRPTNPGTRTITASAPGFETAEQTITLKEGEKQDLELALTPGAVPPPPPGAGKGGSSTEPEPLPPLTPREEKAWGFYGSLRLGGAIPSGSLGKDPNGQDVAISDQFEAGGGGELRGGVRFARYFTPILYFEFYNLKPGAEFNRALSKANTEVETVTTAAAFGIGVMFGTPPGDEFGGFGEVGLSAHRMAAALTVKDEGRTCRGDVTYSGLGVRLGGGLNVPVTKHFQLEPFMGLTLSSFSQIEASYDSPAVNGCAKPIPLGGTADSSDQVGLSDLVAVESSATIPEDRRSLHTLFSLGLGGSFVGP